MRVPEDSSETTHVIHRRYQDAQGVIRTEYRDEQGKIYTEYEDNQGNIHSYENGHDDRQLIDEQNQDLRAERADKNISKGVLIGVIVSCVAGLTAGTIYFLTKQNTPQLVSIVNRPIPRYMQSSSPPSQVIRVVEQPLIKVVEVPQNKLSQATGNATATNAQPAEPQLSTQQRSKAVTQPSPRPDSLAPQPAITSSSKENLTDSGQSKLPGDRKPSPLIRSDSDLKNDILDQFQAKLPRNQLIFEVNNGDVTVSGTVTTPEQLKQIQPMLSSIQGVGKVKVLATADPSKI